MRNMRRHCGTLNASNGVLIGIVLFYFKIIQQPFLPGSEGPDVKFTDEKL